MESGRILAACAPGTRGVVAALAPRDARLRRKLQALGLREGGEIVLLQTFPAYVVACGYTQAAFDARVAGAILLRTERQK